MKVMTRIALATVAMAVAAGSMQAQTYTLTFDNGGSGQPGNGSVIPTTYGSVAGVVNVASSVRNEGGFDGVCVVGSASCAPGTAISPAGVFRFRNGGFASAAIDDYAGADQGYPHLVGQFEFTGIAAGSTITFQSVLFGNIPAPADNVQYGFFTGTDVYLGGGTINVPAQGVATLTLSPFITSPTNTLRFVFSSNGQNEQLQNLAIDNIKFTVNAAAALPTDIAPEPASMMLLATGLVGIAGAGLKRRRTN